MLQVLDINTGILTGSVPQDKRKELCDAFNKKDKKCILLNCNFLINCCGLNLRYKCNVSAHLDPLPSEPIGAQAAGRLCQFGQRRDVVHLLQFSVPGSFNDEQALYDLVKVLPQLIAELDLTTYQQSLNEEPGTEKLFGTWVKVGDEVMPAQMAEDFGRVGDRHILNDDDVLQYLRLLLLGKQMDLEQLGEGRPVEYAAALHKYQEEEHVKEGKWKKEAEEDKKEAHQRRLEREARGGRVYDDGMDADEEAKSESDVTEKRMGMCQ